MWLKVITIWQLFCVTVYEEWVKGFYLSTVAESEQVSPSLNHQCQMASFLVVQDVKSIKIELSLPPVEWSSCYLITIDFTQRICDTVSMMPLTVNVFKMIVKCTALVWTLNRIYFMTFYKPLIPCLASCSPASYCWNQPMVIFLFNMSGLGQTPSRRFCAFHLQTCHLHSHSYQRLLSRWFAMGGPCGHPHTMDFSMSKSFKWSLTSPSSTAGEASLHGVCL